MARTFPTLPSHAPPFPRFQVRRATACSRTRGTKTCSGPRLTARRPAGPRRPWVPAAAPRAPTWLPVSALVGGMAGCCCCMLCLAPQHIVLTLAVDASLKCGRPDARAGALLHLKLASIERRQSRPGTSMDGGLQGPPRPRTSMDGRIGAGWGSPPPAERPRPATSAGSFATGGVWPASPMQPGPRGTLDGFRFALPPPSTAWVPTLAPPVPTSPPSTAGDGGGSPAALLPGACPISPRATATAQGPAPWPRPPQQLVHGPPAGVGASGSCWERSQPGDCVPEQGWEALSGSP